MEWAGDRGKIRMNYTQDQANDWVTLLGHNELWNIKRNDDRCEMCSLSNSFETILISLVSHTLHDTHNYKFMPDISALKTKTLPSSFNGNESTQMFGTLSLCIIRYLYECFYSLFFVFVNQLKFWWHSLKMCPSHMEFFFVILQVNEIQLEIVQCIMFIYPLWCKNIDAL